jgi:hypothetical protein
MPHRRLHSSLPSDGQSPHPCTTQQNLREPDPARGALAADPPDPAAPRADRFDRLTQAVANLRAAGRRPWPPGP